MKIPKELLAPIKKFLAAEDHKTGGVRIAYEMCRTFKGSVSSLIENLYSFFESTHNSWPPMSKDGSITPACAKGCFYCCSLNVDVHYEELSYIWSRVKKQFPEEQIANIITRAESNYTKKAHVYDKNPEDLIKVRVLCPFLENNICSIYAIRPLSCRGMFVANRDNCRKSYTENIDLGNDFWAAPKYLAEDLSLGLALYHLDTSEELQVTQIERAILKEHYNDTSFIEPST